MSFVFMFFIRQSLVLSLKSTYYTWKTTQILKIQLVEERLPPELNHINRFYTYRHFVYRPGQSKWHSYCYKIVYFRLTRSVRLYHKLFNRRLFRIKDCFVVQKTEKIAKIWIKLTKTRIQDCSKSSWIK